jgi:hypothetical protein
MTIKYLDPGIWNVKVNPLFRKEDSVLLIEISKSGTFDWHQAMAIKDLTFGKYKEFISYLL